jgi:hypothetical protein
MTVSKIGRQYANAAMRGCHTCGAVLGHVGAIESYETWAALKVVLLNSNSTRKFVEAGECWTKSNHL